MTNDATVRVGCAAGARILSSFNRGASITTPHTDVRGAVPELVGCIFRSSRGQAIFPDFWQKEVL